MPDTGELFLFSALTTELNRHWQQVQSEVGRDVLRFPASERDRLGHSLFSNLKRGGVCTLVVTGRNPWDPTEHYYQVARSAAKRGLQIERAFLLANKHCRRDPSLQRHVQLDQAAGIKTSIYYVGELISTFSLPPAQSLDFGLWDDVVTCVGVYGRGADAATVSEWRVSQRPEDVQLLQEVIATLREKAPQVALNGHESQRSLDLEEPMIITAPMAQELASVLCQGDHVSPEDCSWYHGVWQYLRIFDMVSTPTWHAKFYLDALQAAAGKGDCSRVLISGTADYSMLAHVLWAYRSVNQKVDVVVLDLCETPLLLCKWYGKFVGTPVSTIASDILTLNPSLPFDVIATDAFLTRFSPPDRQSLIHKWSALLKVGGRVITTIRIEPGLSRECVHTSPDQADAFRRRALQEARRWQGFLAIALEDVANHAQRYAERMTSYSLRSREEVRDLFDGANFTIESLNLNEVPGEMAGTTYAEVVAVRRE